jgi:peptidyl-prolyl cis-trans isomerase SurA
MLKPRLFSLLTFCTALTIATINGGADCWAKNEIKTEPQTGGALNIAAVVGEQAISSFDVDSRVKFIIATTKISNTPDVLANIRPQVIRTLIDESLQLQEAGKNNINVDDKEVEQAIAGIETQRGMPAGGIANMLAASHVPEKTFKDQIRAQLAWGKLLGRTVRPRIKISDDEVALAQGHISSSEQEPINIKEVEVSVINLPVEKPQQEADAKKLIEKLHGELRKGANFEEVAKQFSAAGDGKSFWIRPAQLDPTIAQTLKNTKAGTFTAPIRTHDGFSIIKLLNVKANKSREKIGKSHTEVTMKEILLKLKPTANEKEVDVLLKIGEEVSKNPGSCQEKGVANISNLDDFDIVVNFRKAALSELPTALRSISETLKINDVSIPFASAEGIRLYILCDRKEVAGTPANLDKVKESLFRQKFDLEAQKYLRDVRREAFINIRQ